MDPLERLVGYLADDLDAGERAALEAELARDPRLRGQLDALRTADVALDGLRSPEPPAGFETRLDAAVSAALADLHAEQAEDRSGAEVASATRSPTPRGELAARRERRRVAWSWKPALAGAAAALALLVGGLAVANLAGRDEADVAAIDAPTADMAEGLAEDAEEAMDDAGEAGPVIVATGRDLTEDEVDALLAEPTLAAIANRNLDEAGGAQLAMGWQAALGSTRLAEDPPAALHAVPSEDEDAPEEEALEDEAPAYVPPVETQRVGDELTDEDEASITRCLDEVLDADARAIPAYVELATFEGEEVVVYGLVTRPRDTEAYIRTEAWVVARTDCRVVRFSQAG